MELFFANFVLRFLKKFLKVLCKLTQVSDKLVSHRNKVGTHFDFNISQETCLHIPFTTCADMYILPGFISKAWFPLGVNIALTALRKILNALKLGSSQLIDSAWNAIVSEKT